MMPGLPGEKNPAEGILNFIQENFNALMEAIVKAKPSALKGQYLRSITLTSTTT